MTIGIHNVPLLLNTTLINIYSVMVIILIWVYFYLIHLGARFEEQ